MKKAIALFCLCCLLVCGCSQSKENTQETIHITVPVDYPVTVNGVTIEDCPYKVVSLSPEITEVIYSLGSSSQLCGVSDECDYPDIPKKMQRMGTAIQPEYTAIIDAGADVVLTSKQLPQNAQTALSDAQIPIIVIKAPNKWKSMPKFYRNIGSVMSGKTAGVSNADNTWSRISGSVITISAHHSTLPTAAIILPSGEIASGDTVAGHLLSSAVMTNVAQGKFSPKQLIEAAPQYIFCSEQNLEQTKEKYGALNSQIFAVYSSTSIMYGDRMVDVVKQIEAKR